MPDDSPGEGVEQRPVQERPVVKPIDPPAPPNDPPSPPAQSVANNGMEEAVHAIEDRVKRAEWLMIGLTAGIVLLTLGLVIVGILQWSAMSGQLAEMKSGGKDTHALAVAAGRQAEAAGKQADRMKDQADQTKAIAEQARIQAVTALASVTNQERQLALTDRAWIRVEVAPNVDIPQNSLIGGPLTFDANGRGSLSLKIILHNIGRSVATDARVRDAIVVGVAADPSVNNVWLPVDTQRKFCASSNAPPSTILGRPSPSYTVFPGDTTETYEFSTFETVNIPDVLSRFNSNLKWGKPIVLFLVGCVDYRYGVSKQMHQTGFVFEVYGDSKHQSIQVGMPTPVIGVTFEKFFLGGEYAN